MILSDQDHDHPGSRRFADFMDYSPGEMERIRITRGYFRLHFEIRLNADLPALSGLNTFIRRNHLN